MPENVLLAARLKLGHSSRAAERPPGLRVRFGRPFAAGIPRERRDRSCIYHGFPTVAAAVSGGRSRIDAGIAAARFLQSFIPAGLRERRRAPQARCEPMAGWHRNASVMNPRG